MSALDYSDEIMKMAKDLYGCDCDNCCAQAILVRDEMLKVDKRLQPLAKSASDLNDEDLKAVEDFAAWLDYRRRIFKMAGKSE